MYLTTEQIIAFLKLPKVGRAGMFKVLQYANKTDGELQSASDMLVFYKECVERKFLLRNKDFCYDTVVMQDSLDYARHVIEQSSKLGITTIGFTDDKFPKKLKSIVDEKGKNISPLVLYAKGDLSHLNDKAIAIIGTREPTSSGVIAGKHFASMFAKDGFNIVSGLAIGCDTLAHQGALSVNGTTTAFVAHGLDQEIYPSSNIELANDILDNGGLIISEYPIGEPLMANRLVERDRLQSGLADATLVIQTGIKGGTMHAVNATIANKKPLLMVDYLNEVDRTQDKVQGNIKLINDGTAFPLGTSTYQDALKLISDSIDKKSRVALEHSVTELTLF